MPSFSQRSLDKLNTCDQRIQRVFLEVIKHRDCMVIEGHRGKTAQDAAFNSGMSKTPWPRSKHNRSPSLAVDVMPWYPEAPHIRWDMNNPKSSHELREFAGFVLGVAAGMGIDLRWGGHWRSFFDGPHYELGE